MIWNTSQRTFDLHREGLIMGILNVTPDSFSDGGRFISVDRALAHARAMADQGAAIIDVGGESTRPGASAVGIEEELARVIPPIEAIKREFGDRCAISIDTMKAKVASQAIEAGAEIINDVTGLRGDPDMMSVAAESKAGLVVMHMKGTPRNMQRNPVYRDVLSEVREFFEESHQLALDSGIEAERLVYDPGIGFGKTLDHNLQLLKGLGALRVSNRPLLLGLSRKSFIGMILGGGEPGDRIGPTVALTSLARETGAEIFRVHDVKENFEAMKMSEAIMGGSDAFKEKTCP